MQNLQSWTIDDIVVTRMPPAHRRSWVAIGSEPDIKHVMRLWGDLYRFNLSEIPENADVYWDITNKLLHNGRRDTVRITNGTVEIDRRKLEEFREGCDWLFDMLAEEHSEERYEYFAHLKDWVRCDDAPQPITELEDARRAIDVLDAIFEIAADNVIRVSDRAVA